MTVTEHMLRARQAKARKLAAVVVEVAKGTGRLPSEVARRMHADERETACRIAGVHPASSDTWAEVIETLETAESIANAFAGVGR